MALGLVFVVHIALQVYVPFNVYVNPTSHAVAAEALVGLDGVNSNALAQLVQAGIQTGDWGKLASGVAAALPSGFNYELHITDSSGKALPGTPLRSGLIQGTVTAVTYVVPLVSAETVRVYYVVLIVSAS